MSTYIYKVNPSKVITAHNQTTDEEIKIITASYWFKPSDSAFGGTDWDKINPKIERIEDKVRDKGIERVVFDDAFKRLAAGEVVYRYNGEGIFGDEPDYTQEGAIGWIWKEGRKWMYRDTTELERRQLIKTSPNYSFSNSFK